MIEFGDEQGYAPASILEAVDGNGTEHNMENTIDGVCVCVCVCVCMCVCVRACMCMCSVTLK